MTSINPVDSLTLPELIVKIADDRKASNIIQMDVRDLTILADNVIILSGTSAPHLRALSDRINRDVRERLDIRPRVIDGTAASGWILMDYSTVIVHILTPEVRDRYDLERLWADAPRIDTLTKLQHFREKAKLESEQLIAAAAAKTSVVAKRTPVKKSDDVSEPVKKAPVSKTKSAVKKETVKKSTVKKTVVEKAPAKKPAAKKKTAVSAEG